MTKFLTTILRDVLDPLSGTRRDIAWRSDGTVLTPDDIDSPHREIDGAALWLLPPLYDADAHLGLQTGIRRLDALRALAGGVGQMNVAIPWDDAVALGIEPLAAELAAEVFPRMVPLLSVSPEASSEGFTAWLETHAQVFSTILPPLCKLYSYDPHFDRNIEVLWANGIKPVVWARTDEDLAHVVDLAGSRPIHLRHATSPEMIGRMRSATAATIQTSPHFLLPLARGSDELTVWPPVPGGDAYATLRAAALAHVDIIASDHNPLPFAGAPTGPGLQSQQQMLSALLHLVDHAGWSLADIVRLARDNPARVFGVPAPEGLLIVDPKAAATVFPWPGQPGDRAPYAGMTLRGRVLAIAIDDRLQLI